MTIKDNIVTCKDEITITDNTTQNVERLMKANKKIRQNKNQHIQNIPPTDYQVPVRLS